MCSQTVTLFKRGREKPQTVAERVQKHRKKHTNVSKNNFVSRKDAANMNIQQRIHKDQYDKNRKDSLTDVEFPPKPADFKRLHGITKRFCEQIAPSNFIEAGCAVCGQLTLLSELTPLSEINIHLDILFQEGISRKERNNQSQPIEDVLGPIIDTRCGNICDSCFKTVSKGKIPLISLANGLWLGEVPDELQNLGYAEKLLIARVRHNRCVVRVKSGMHKMTANVITFANPTAKIYHTLPPPTSDLDEVLAFIYTGPCKPTLDDYKRTPLLVRRNKVGRALEWLKLNHEDYADINISYENLAEYPEHGPPVIVDYRPSCGNKASEAMASNDNDEEEGTTSGQCPFTVQGLTGDDLENKPWKTLIAIVLKHLTDGKRVMVAGHDEKPQSLFNNPRLYPQMFPWLFPYGKGSIGQDRHKKLISTMTHKRLLLMYHDKRFQTDPDFPLIALNHEQIQSGTTGGYLLVKKKEFQQITDRILNLDLHVLAALTK